jgi:hypothetical protein
MHQRAQQLALDFDLTVSQREQFDVVFAHYQRGQFVGLPLFNELFEGISSSSSAWEDFFNIVQKRGHSGEFGQFLSKLQIEQAWFQKAIADHTRSEGELVRLTAQLKSSCETLLEKNDLSRESLRSTFMTEFRSNKPIGTWFMKLFD